MTLPRLRVNLLFADDVALGQRSRPASSCSDEEPYEVEGPASRPAQDLLPQGTLSVSACGPAAPSFDLYREGWPLRWLLALLGIPVDEQTQRPFELRALADDPRAAVGADPP